MRAHPHQHSHHEQHSTGAARVRDIILGMSDGLTVPFALAAGLSGALQSARVVMVGGAAELVAGCLAMGLGAYLAAQGEADSYRSELRRERREVRDIPDEERAEVRRIFEEYGLEGEALTGAVTAVTSNPRSWVQFMMREELHLEKPEEGHALASALTIGLSYVVGGAIPLSPYAFGLPVSTALVCSVVVTSLALLAFGAAKARYTGVAPLRGALQTTVVGGCAAGAAYLLAVAVGRLG